MGENFVSRIKLSILRRGVWGESVERTFDVLNSVHHYTIEVNQPTICNIFTSLLLDIYLWLNMFLAPFRPSLEAYNCTRSSWFYRWRVAGETLLVVAWQFNLPDHDQKRSNRHSPTVKPGAPSAFLRFWWWVEWRPKRVQPYVVVK
jgi:hypothetical protein